MLMPILESIAMERAELSRDIAYITEMAADGELGDMVIAMEDGLNPKRKAYEEKDAEKTVRQIVCESDEGKDVEIDHILKSKNDIVSFDEMLGIE